MLSIQKKINYYLNSRQYYNNYYTRSISKYEKVSSYINLYESFFKSFDAIKTTEKINHTSSIAFGMPLNKVKKQINVPYRLVKNNTICDIIFYKTRIGIYKIVVELHFFKRKLVFFKYTLPSVFNKSKLEALFQKKYLLNKFNFKNQSITDGFNNYLKVENEVSFSIHYFSLNFGFYDFLMQKKENQKLKENLRKKLIHTKLLDRI